jgi:hypothetical protein
LYKTGIATGHFGGIITRDDIVGGVGKDDGIATLLCVGDDNGDGAIAQNGFEDAIFQPGGFNRKGLGFPAEDGSKTLEEAHGMFPGAGWDLI